AHAGDSQYLRVYIRQLRAKLGDDAADPRWIFTEPGVGYRLADR
ncbi:helix-turn-helix domain-containing protein, partial [Paracoccus sp. PXZ]